MTSQSERADAFHRLHHEGVLVLPNAWDVASARLVEDAGGPAVATSSGAVAWGLGWPDGDRLPRERAVDLIARVAGALTVPLTADVESGFGATRDDVAETIRQVIGAGAVGVNVEDGDPSADPGPLRDLDAQAERLTAIRSAADATGVRLFLNARTDVFLRGAGEPAGRLAEAVRRAEAYLLAGADGIFVPGVVDPATVRELVAAVDAPLNVLAGPGAPTVPELADLGVRRVSLGTSVAGVAYAAARRAVVEALGAGSYGALGGGLPYGDLQRLFGA